MVDAPGEQGARVTYSWRDGLYWAKAEDIETGLSVACCAETYEQVCADVEEHLTETFRALSDPTCT